MIFTPLILKTNRMALQVRIQCKYLLRIIFTYVKCNLIQLGIHISLKHCVRYKHKITVVALSIYLNKYVGGKRKKKYL